MFAQNIGSPAIPQDYVRNIREPDPKVIGTPQPEPQFTAEALALCLQNPPRDFNMATSGVTSFHHDAG